MIPPVGGVLLLDKPVGLSSNAALQRVRRLAGNIKAGHTGSLDPLASGMLPICLGEATKLAGEMLSQNKCYQFGVLLGERSDTGDAEGEIIERGPIPDLSAESIGAVLQGFLGQQQQIPPMYSALKRDGEPLYRLARRGVSVEREPRSIRIDSLQLLGLAADRLELRVACSKGTYVRVLAEDLARALGSCGRLFRLRREFVEPFSADPMTSLEELEAGDTAKPWPLLAPDRAVSHLPALHLETTAVRALAHGQRVPAATEAPGIYRLYDASGQFVGLGECDATRTLAVRRLFSAAQQ